jgi:oxygen-independent coproporphyrinogen III oxidase
MLSLYIHVPFCVGKCHYCGFYSTIYAPEQANEYVAALCFEAAKNQHVFNARIFDSVYIGGGTPTALSSDQLEKLIAALNRHFHISRDAEFTIEANPKTVSESQLALLREAGVNRLSLGVQSFNDDVLKTLGRLHSAREAVDAFMLARSAGFANIGIDLIYGVPGQTDIQWNETLDRAIFLKPEHVSAYSLSIDEGSRFRRETKAGRFALPGDDQVATMYGRAVKDLGLAGYSRYEISNFSLPGFICRHNMNYWERGEYLGLGPGAWSFISGRRYRTIADMREYSLRTSAGLPLICEEEVATLRQAANETVMLGLRTVQGVDRVRYEREFGADAAQLLEKNAAPLKQAGLIEKSIGRIRLSEKGFLLADEALARLVW